MKIVTVVPVPMVGVHVVILNKGVYMSWQADIKRLHNDASWEGVDLLDFNLELEEDDGWYNEGNIQTFIQCLIEEVSRLKSEV